MKPEDIRYEDFNWKDKKLYLGKTDTKFSVFNGEEDIYWVKWPDGQISADFYNLTRAKDNCVKMALSTYNKELSVEPRHSP